MAFKSFRFNHAVGANLFEVSHPLNPEEKIVMLNTICWGTNVQVVTPMNGPRTPEHVFGKLSDSWLRHFGTPEVFWDS